MELKILKTKKVDEKLLNQLETIKKQIANYNKNELKQQLTIVVDFLIKKTKLGE